MLHEPAVKAEDGPASGYKTRLGVWMFLIYSAVYAGFVLINVLFPAWMGFIVVLGLNPAMVYGFGLTEADALIPFNNPGIVSIPLSFLTLVGVSLLTRKKARRA